MEVKSLPIMVQNYNHCSRANELLGQKKVIGNESLNLFNTVLKERLIDWWNAIKEGSQQFKSYRNMTLKLL